MRRLDGGVGYTSMLLAETQKRFRHSPLHFQRAVLDDARRRTNPVAERLHDLSRMIMSVSPVSAPAKALISGEFGARFRDRHGLPVMGLARIALQDRPTE